MTIHFHNLQKLGSKAKHRGKLLIILSQFSEVTTAFSGEKDITGGSLVSDKTLAAMEINSLLSVKLTSFLLHV